MVTLASEVGGAAVQHVGPLRAVGRRPAAPARPACRRRAPGQKSPTPNVVRGWRRRAAGQRRTSAHVGPRTRSRSWPRSSASWSLDVAGQVRRAQVGRTSRPAALGCRVRARSRRPPACDSACGGPGLVVRLAAAVRADARALVALSPASSRADVDHLADAEAGHDHRRGAGQHGRGVAPSPAGGEVDDRGDSRGAGLVAGQAGEHRVEPVGDVGRASARCGGRRRAVGVPPTPARGSARAASRHRAGRSWEVASSRGFRSVWLGRDQPGSGGARDASVVRTGGSGSGFPGARGLAHHRAGRTPSRLASRARPREQRDFTVPTAQSSIAATSATG